MGDNSGRRSKKNGIKAHKAAIDRKDIRKYGIFHRGRKPSGEGRKRREEGPIQERPERRRREEGPIQERPRRRRGEGFEETPIRSKGQEIVSQIRELARRLYEGEDPEEERHGGRHGASSQRRRQRQQRQRLIVIAAMVFALVFFVLAVRAVVKGISHRMEEKAKAASAEIENSKPKIEEKTAVITTAGDIILHRPFLESSVYFDGENYDYNAIFTYMKELYQAADFTVVTTEYVLTGGDYSGYPVFCAPDAIAEALGANGVDMCLLGNNHIYDGGDEGLQRTMDVLTENNILYTGARKSAEDKNYVVQEINGIKVGFINYVYETETVDGNKTINGIALSQESADLINSFQEADPQSLYDDVEKILAEMGEQGVEYTIAYMHWGVEYQTEENSYQDAIAQKLCDMGIDALIASHPHVIEPVDLLESSDGKHKMVCAYAIGNHLSNQRTEYMDGLVDGYSEDGMAVTLTIHRDTKGKITLEKADFTPTWVYHDQSVDDEYFILPLNQADKLGEVTGLAGIEADVDASLKRTNGIIGEGVKKVQEALPLKQ